LGLGAVDSDSFAVVMVFSGGVGAELETDAVPVAEVLVCQGAWRVDGPSRGGVEAGDVGVSF
jgi:hypothetical protein